MQADLNWFGVLAHHAVRSPDKAMTVFEDDTVLEAGMTLTDEPSILLDGSFAANFQVGANAGEIVNANSGQATITFDNGCAVKVQGREYTIPAQAPVCHTGVIPVTGDGQLVALGVAGAVALGLAVGSGGGGGNDRPSSP